MRLQQRRGAVLAGLGARAGIRAGLAGGRSTWWSRRSRGRGSWRGARLAAGIEKGEAEPAGAAIEGREEEKLGRLRTKLERDAWAARAQVELQLIPG